MFLFFVLLPFLPTFCFSVTKAMLENDGPDFNEVNHFKNLDNIPMCPVTARKYSQIFEVALMQTLSHFKESHFQVSQSKYH